jgi:hypothetical protein
MGFAVDQYAPLLGSLSPSPWAGPSSLAVVQYSCSTADPSALQLILLAVVAVLIGAANRGSHGVLIHQLEDLHRWGIADTRGAEGN